MKKRIPEKLSDTFMVYRRISLKDSLVILLAVAVSLLILKAETGVRIYLILIIDPLILSLLIKVNDERLYVSVFYIIRYFIYEKPRLYLMNMKNNLSAEELIKDTENLEVLRISKVPFDILEEEKQDRIINALSYALRGQEQRDAYLISLDRETDIKPYLEAEYRKLEKIKSLRLKMRLSEEEYEARKSEILSSVSSLKNLVSGSIKERCYYLVLYKGDDGFKEGLVAALSSFGSSLISVQGEEKEKVLREYSGLTGNENVRVNSGSVSFKKGRYCFIYLSSYPSLSLNGDGREFMSVPGTVSCLSFRKENPLAVKKKADSEILELDSIKTPRESEKIKAQEERTALEEMLEDSGSGETLHSFSVILRCPEKDKKKVISLLRQRGIRGTVRAGRTYEILKKFMFMVSSFKEKHYVSSLTLASFFPFSSWDIKDEDGILMGVSEGPVFIDFLKRDDMHLNSNMVVIGKSGSGKSYFTKSLLLKLACVPSKIFILDPEGEYEKLSLSLGGEVMDLGSSWGGTINPFDIRGEKDSATFYSHLQFLEELYHLLFTGIPDECTECLNTYTLKLYRNFDIGPDSDFNLIPSSSFPTFSDLYLLIRKDVKSETAKKTLSFLSKVSNGGMNSNILDGHTDISFERSVTDFSFLKLMSSSNRNIINANMLVILKHLETEVLRSRDNPYKTVIVIDEAHLFIDEKYPAALDFMFSMAKRIRKYNGMQIVITQNLKDFSLSSEIRRKSEALISVSQYSLIFSSSPQDVRDITELYKSSGGISENEKRIISSLHLGYAFFIKNPEIRTTFKVVTNSVTEEKFI